jgi:Stress responsive A/B Barrel Domain
MFRQVVVCQWAEGTSPEAKQAFRDALDGLRSIPELLALTWGDDAGHFDGNFDLVAVMDFADFAAARRYVAHPLHQAYVRDHASTAIGTRMIVQHDWVAPEGP